MLFDFCCRWYRQHIFFLDLARYVVASDITNIRPYQADLNTVTPDIQTPKDGLDFLKKSG